MVRAWLFPIPLIGLLLLIVGAIVQSNVESAAIIGTTGMVLGGALIAVSLVARAGYDAFRKHRAVTALDDRHKLDAATFGETYFADSPERANLAARVRDALSGYLKLNLDGLRPDDDLDQILDAQTDDPSLVWHLEETFNLGHTFNDAETFDRIHKSLRTFRGLLEFVESRIAAK